jgi:hypothetical protein
MHKFHCIFIHFLIFAFDVRIVQWIHLTKVISIYLIVVCFSIGIAGVFIANEEISLGGAQTNAVARAALSDATLFVRNSHAQLHFVVSNSLDQAVDATIADLDSQFIIFFVYSFFICFHI